MLPHYRHLVIHSSTTKSLQRNRRIVELEAKLAELEPYRSFVEQVRQRIRHEEHNDNTPYHP